MTNLKWLTPKRRSESGNNLADKSFVRNRFDKDLGSLIYLSQFRRQAGKTQVYMMPKDNVRNRLTHSIEVSHVAEQLLNIFLYELEKKFRETLDREMYRNLLTVLKASCLVHDIGHPPFAHSGERVLSELRQSLSGRFDSNLQNLRILGSLSPLGIEYDLKLSDTVVDSVLKEKHDGFFRARDADCWLEAEKNLIIDVSKSTGTYLNVDDNLKKVICDFDDANRRYPRLCTSGIPKKILVRHPITYFMTCADDICYLSSDVEDAINRGGIELNHVVQTLVNLKIPCRNSNYTVTNKGWKVMLSSHDNSPKKLRTAIIKSLIGRTAEVLKSVVVVNKKNYSGIEDFLQHLPLILVKHSVTFWTPDTEFGNFLYMRNENEDDSGASIRKYKKKIFAEGLFLTREVLEENAGAKSIVEKLYQLLVSGIRISRKPVVLITKRAAFISPEYRNEILKILEDNKKALVDRVSKCEAILIDFIAGMTDAYARDYLKWLEGSDFMKINMLPEQAVEGEHA